jgi:hypothetical protein
MNLGELRVRFGWFKAESELLDDLAEELDCLRRSLDGIHLTVETSEFRSIQEDYDKLHDALTIDANSVRSGVVLVRNYGGAIRTTGRTYLQTESENADDAAAITKEMNDAGF